MQPQYNNSSCACPESNRICKRCKKPFYLPLKRHRPNGNFCSVRCKFPPTREERLSYFWDDVDMDTPDHCWPWMIGKDQAGYGHLMIRGKHEIAHRVAYEIANGPIPPGLEVMHKCDNPPCCNPSHLAVGTRADNARDAQTKGRVPHGDSHYSRVHPELLARGERHGTHTHPEKVRRGDQHLSRLHPECLARG